MREKQNDERLCGQPLLKVSVWRDSPAGGRILDFALLFEGGTAVTRDSECFPRQMSSPYLFSWVLPKRIEARF